MARGAPSTDIFRLALLICLSVVVMIIDFRSHYLHYIRSGLSVVITPVQVVATLPQEIADRVSVWFVSGEVLRDKHEVLRTEHSKLQAKLQTMRALERENASLRDLLDASKKVPDKVLMAELVEVSLDPYTHKILVDRGLNDGAHVGQPVFDPSGVMGQVTQVMPFTSAVTLITDPSHAMPVLVQRNGLRAVVFGSGNSARIRVSYLSPSADIKVGDLLLSSGLGGRFPAGYPVARIVSVENDPGEAFLFIDAEPTAQINRASQVLLVWRGGAEDEVLVIDEEDAKGPGNATQESSDTDSGDNNTVGLTETDRAVSQ